MKYNPNNIRELARAISAVEKREPAALAQLASVHAAGGHCRVLGVTGPPGAGKSTLVDQLIYAIRAKNERVAVVAIDPSSPFSGGAVLGDRIRMQEHAADDGVYIRSLGSRGARGGLSHATRDILRVLDAYRFDWIIVETVGVGQSEFDIMELADTTVVVMVPEAGDTVQSLKAGLLEVADIFVVNKADRDGAGQMQQVLQSMVQLSHITSGAGAGDHNASHVMTQDAETPHAAAGEWEAPVLMTVAQQGEGVTELLDSIQSHYKWQESSTVATQRKTQIRALEFRGYMTEQLQGIFDTWIQGDPARQAQCDAVARGEANPYDVAKTLLDDWLRK